MNSQTKARNYPAQFGALGQRSVHRLPQNADGRIYRAKDKPAGAANLTSPLPRGNRVSHFRDNDSVLKNVFDRTAAGLGLIVLAPLLLMVGALIYATNPGPVLFAHERIGKHGRRFKCLKFRTMVTDGDAVLAQHLRDNPDAEAEWRETRKLQDDPRVTPVGDVLRRTSLDELPQIFNILMGQMSVVGPRPIIESEVGYYGDSIDDYLSVRPGLTGLWQVSGRSDVGYDERVALDTDYVKNRTMLGDCAIILRTAKVVALREGSY